MRKSCGSWRRGMWKSLRAGSGGAAGGRERGAGHVGGRAAVFRGQALEVELASLQTRLAQAENALSDAKRQAHDSAQAVRDAQTTLGNSRRAQQETAKELELTRQELSAERARHASIEQILHERAYTADAVQKLFGASGNGAPGSQAFYAVGLLADYAEVEEKYEAAVEQFLRDELEYVVVESFDHARAGVELLRNEMGGRATFFVDSLRSLNLDIKEADANLPLPEGIIARLDRLVEFRDPLGPATKHFLRSCDGLSGGKRRDCRARSSRKSAQLLLDA